MSDEQMIYISPEDDLTAVRERLERLENVPTRHVTLVIPTHTQLRSHVAWKLLYARARDLGKEVLIVSSDPQVRSVAHAAKFKVAHSQESSPVGKSRPATRPGRSGGRGSRTQAPPRTLPGKGPAESRGPTTRSRQPEREVPNSRADEAMTGGLNRPASPTFDLPERPSGSSYGFTNPPIRPLSQQQLEEEPDLLLEDFHLAQDIRQAALKGGAPETPKKKGDTPGPARTPRRATPGRPPASGSEAVFEAADDALPPPAFEPHGPAPIQKFSAEEHFIQDVADLPTEIFEDRIEEGRQGSGFPGIHSWSEPSPEEEQDIVGPTRPQSVRPHSSRTGGRSPERTPLPLPTDFTEDALPPPTPDPSSVLQRPPQRPSAASAKRPSMPLAARPGTAPQTPLPQQVRATGPRSEHRTRSAPISSTTSSRGQITGSAGARSSRSQRSNATLIAAIVVVLILLGLLAYFGPSADIALTLQSHAFSHAVTLTAHAGSQQSSGTVPATLQTQTFTASGKGRATGSAKMGTTPATGNVTFTNNSNHVIVVPTHTIVATSSGIKFDTQAEISLNIAGSNNAGSVVVVPIAAEVSGETGNVAANSIVTMPSDALSALALANNLAVSDLNIKISNDSATSGGGVGNITVATAKDLDAASSALQKQLQSNVNSWLHQLSTGGFLSKPATSVTLVNAPKDGQVVDGGTFPITLNITVNVLLVRSADLQTAAIMQLNTLMQTQKGYTNEVIRVDAKHPLTVSTVNATGDTTTMTLNFTASGQAAPNMSVEQIQQIVSGKTVNEANADLGRLPGVQRVEINRFPGFLPWLPYWPPHIHVMLLPGDAH